MISKNKFTVFHVKLTIKFILHKPYRVMGI